MQRTGQIKYVPNERKREMSKVSGVSSTASNTVGFGFQGSEMLSSMRVATDPGQQKQVLGEHLYPLVHKHKVILTAY